MKNLLLLLLLSFGLIGTASALGAYKCTPVQSYGVTLEGILQNDVDKFPNSHLSEWIKADIVDDFIIDRETGRVLGGNYPFKFKGERFVVVSQGGKNTEFKAYFLPRPGGMMSINIVEHKETFKKPFVYFKSPSPIVVTGTCVNF